MGWPNYSERSQAEETIAELKDENNRLRKEIHRQQQIGRKFEAERDELKAKLVEFQESEFHPDWSMLEATKDSLKEHMRLLKAANAEVGRLRIFIKDYARHLPHCNWFDPNEPEQRCSCGYIKEYKALTPATDASDVHKKAAAFDEMLKHYLRWEKRFNAAPDEDPERRNRIGDISYNAMCSMSLVISKYKDQLERPSNEND